MKQKKLLAVVFCSFLGIWLLAIYGFKPYQKGSTDPFIIKLKKQLLNYNNHYAHEKVYLHTDRTLFEPGEDIWFKAYVKDANTHQASTKSGICYVEFIDPKGTVIKKLTLLAQGGNGHGDFSISPDAVGGLYKLKAYTKWQSNEKQFFEKEINIQRSILPNLSMKLEFERKAFGAGDQVEARLDLASLDNKPLGNHDFQFLVNIGGHQFTQSTGKTDDSGRAYVKFNLPTELNTTDGLLNVMIPYKGQNESISRSIPIVLNQIDVQFFPEGGDLIAGVPSRMAFKAVNEFNKPADVEGFIYDHKKNIIAPLKSFHQGMGAVKFTPQAGVKYHVEITKPVRIKTPYTLPRILSSGASMQVLTNQSEAVQVEVHSTYEQSFYLTAQAGGELFYSEKMNHKGISGQSVFVPVAELPIGIVKLTLFDQNHIELAERLVFTGLNKGLSIDIKTNKTSYQPREKVEMEVIVKDNKGLPVKGNFSLAVTDENLVSFADDKQGHILSHFLLESELVGEIVEPNFYFDPKEEKATEALDYLLMTQGWRRFDWKEVDADKYIANKIEGENAKVSGIVMVKGVPTQSVTVKVKGSDYQVKTDKDGLFVMDKVNLDGTKILEIFDNKGNKDDYTLKAYQEDIIIDLKAKGGVRGVVTDGNSGETLPFAEVTVWKNGVLKTGTQTDFDGVYFLDDIMEGGYDIKVEYVGYTPHEMEGVLISSNNMLKLDFPLRQGVDLTEVVVVEYKVPLINLDMSSSGATISAADIQRLPRRNVSSLAGRAGGINSKSKNKKRREAEQITIRGSRSNDDKFFVDGVRTRGATVDTEDVEEVEAITSGIPAEFGDEETTTKSEVTKSDRVTEEMNKNGMGDVVSKDFNSRAPLDNLKELPVSSEESDEIFSIVEERPQFPGCDHLPTRAEQEQCAEQLMLDFIYDQLQYPALAKENAVNGMVVVSFTVGKTGELQDFNLRRDIGSGCGDEAIRVLQSMPNWRPGKQNGKFVPVQYNIPIRFSPEGRKRKEQTAINFSKVRTFYSPRYPEIVKPEIRTDFRKTVYWNPNVETNASGKANIEFFNSDAMTTLNVCVEGFANKGDIGRKVYKYNVQQSVELRAKVPVDVLSGDQVDIPLTLTNNTSTYASGSLSVKSPENMKAVMPIPNRINLGPKESKTIYLKYEVLNMESKGAFKVAFESGNINDQLSFSIRSQSRGFPVEHMFSGKRLKAKHQLTLNDVVEGSLRVNLSAHPTVLTEILSGLQRMLRQPNGCFEQTSSSNYPNLLVLDYLKSNNVDVPEAKKQAKEFLKRGYKRLTGFESSSGGFDWYGGPIGHEGLTAYGILQFNDMKAVYPVEQEMIDRNVAWLLSRKNGKGSWKRQSRSYKFGANSPQIGDAYIVWALTEAGYGSKIKQEIEKSYKDAVKSEDPYIMALMANVLGKLKDSRAQGLIDELVKHQNASGSFKGLIRSVTNSTGKNLEVETTALSCLAFIRANANFIETKKGIDFIGQSKNNYGFGSTQSTILALKAILAYAKMNKSTKEGGQLELYVNGVKKTEVNYEANQKESIQIKNIEQYLSQGRQDIEIRFVGTKEPLPYELAIHYNTSLPKNDKSCKVNIQTRILKTQPRMGETVRMTTTLKNLGEEVPSTLAIVGIPGGLSLQAWQLKELVEKGKVDFYELWDGYAVFHFKSMDAKEIKTIDLDLKADIPGQFEAPASQAYLYYSNDQKHWSKPEKINIMP